MTNYIEIIKAALNTETEDGLVSECIERPDMIEQVLNTEFTERTIRAINKLSNAKNEDLAYYMDGVFAAVRFQNRPEFKPTEIVKKTDEEIAASKAMQKKMRKITSGCADTDEDLKMDARYSEGFVETTSIVKTSTTVEFPSASKKAKELGLKSLTEVSELSGQSLQTLTNWFNDKPELFEVVLLGCLAKNNSVH